MKIGIDIRCLMQPQYSGISEYTYNLLKNIFETDSTNQYVLFYNSGKQPDVPNFDFSNVTFKEYKFPNKLFNLSLRFLKITEIDKLIGGVDVFLSPNFLFTNLSKDCRQVIIVHDLTFELYPEFFTAKNRLWHKLIGPKQMCQNADVIIAISHNTKNDIVKIFGINPNKIQMIYPGIANNFFEQIADDQKIATKKKYNLPDNYIFYLGNLEPRKNIETLLKAFELLEDKNISLVLAGSKAWKYKNINKLYNNSKVKNRIKFLGYVDAADKPALYNLAKVFVYPSIYEGFGLPPLEAAASGTPVISSFNSSLVEAVGKSGLLIDPNNYNELAKVIDKLLNDEKLQQHLIERGKENVKKFKWEVASAKILEIITKRS